MVNVDGVIHGHLRSSMLGQDKNRNWNIPKPEEFPVIYQIKKLVKKFNKETKLKIIGDFHGHSRRFNTFIYGCDPCRTVEARIFSLIMEKISKYFTFSECRFDM